MTSDCSNDSVGRWVSCNLAGTMVHIDSCISSCKGDHGVSAINTSAAGEWASVEAARSAHIELRAVVELTLLRWGKPPPQVLWHQRTVALDGVVESQASCNWSPGSLTPSTFLGMLELVSETGHVRLMSLERPPHVLAGFAAYASNSMST